MVKKVLIGLVALSAINVYAGEMNVEEYIDLRQENINQYTKEEPMGGLFSGQSGPLAVGGIGYYIYKGIKGDLKFRDASCAVWVVHPIFDQVHQTMKVLKKTKQVKSEKKCIDVLKHYSNYVQVIPKDVLPIVATANKHLIKCICQSVGYKK